MSPYLTDLKFFFLCSTKSLVRIQLSLLEQTRDSRAGWAKEGGREVSLLCGWWSGVLSVECWIWLISDDVSSY